ncbi:lipoprotein [Shewanella sp. Isolate11]|nr:lipoprotein [Shewanella sp. Isolate11]
MAACGQKGPLYKSPEIENNQSQQPAEAPVQQSTTTNKKEQ